MIVRPSSPRERSPTVVITLEDEEIPEILAEFIITSTPNGRLQQRRARSRAEATLTSGTLEHLADSEQRQNSYSNSWPRVESGLQINPSVGTNLAMSRSTVNNQLAMDGYTGPNFVPTPSWSINN